MSSVRPIDANELIRVLKSLRFDSQLQRNDMLTWFCDTAIHMLKNEGISPTLNYEPATNSEWRYNEAEKPRMVPVSGYITCWRCQQSFERIVGRKFFARCPCCGARMKGGKTDERSGQ